MTAPMRHEHSSRPRAQPGPPARWEQGRGYFLTTSLVVLCGYLAFGRPFSQIGSSGLNMYIGETVLIASLAVPAVRAVLAATWHSFRRPGHFHPFVWIWAALFTVGCVHLVLALWHGPEPLEALKIFAFNYLTGFLLIGITVRALREDFLAWLCRYLPWVNAAVIITFKLILQNKVGIPFNKIHKIAPQAGTIVTLALMLCYERPLMKRWYLFLANAFVLLYMQVRAGWLSVVVAALIWAVLTRQVRVLTRVASAALAALIFLAILDVKIPGSPDRGGQVSITGILARTVAPFDERLAAKYSTDSEGFKDTAAWRQIWWDFIWTEVHSTPIRTVYGLGYGRPLSYLAENVPEAEKPIRAPHNVFFFALGYEGWLGVLLAGLFQAGLFRLAWVVWKQRREPFPLMLAAMGLCMGLFDNFYETPFAAVPMYFLLGVALAPAAPELVRAAQTATRRSGCP